MPSICLDLALQPKQEQLYRLIEAKGLDCATVLGYGGALGGGKSAAIRRIMLARRFRYPRTNGVILRRVFDDVKKNHIDPLFLDYPDLREYYRTSDHELVLPNRSRLLFMYAETLAEVIRKFTGIEFFDIFPDQAEQFSEAELRHIKTRNRWPGTAPGECKTALFYNPGGPGGEYLRRIFYLRQYKTGERAQDYAFIQAYGWDNYQWFRALGLSEREFYALSNEERFELFIHETQYGRELNALPPTLRAGHLLGSFESFAGQYFAGVWDEAKCCLTIDQAERLIQPWWTRWMSTDWGFAHHFSHHWWASGKLSPRQFREVFGCETQWPVEVVIAYREFIGSEMAEPDLAEAIADMTPSVERQLIRQHFLSPDAFAKKGSAHTVAQQLEDVFRRHGLPAPEPADNDRIGGWRLLYNGFRQSGALRAGAEISAEQAKAGPMLLISAACPEAMAAVPILIRDEKNPEDVLKTPTLADDVGDELRYGYKSMLDPRSRAPRAVRAQETFEETRGDMTAKAMAMLRFNQAERQRSRGIVRPRGR